MHLKPLALSHLEEKKKPKGEGGCDVSAPPWGSYLWQIQRNVSELNNHVECHVDHNPKDDECEEDSERVFLDIVFVNNHDKCRENPYLTERVPCMMACSSAVDDHGSFITVSSSLLFPFKRGALNAPTLPFFRRGSSPSSPFLVRLSSFPKHRSCRRHTRATATPFTRDNSVYINVFKKCLFSTKAAQQSSLWCFCDVSL